MGIDPEREQQLRAMADELDCKPRVFGFVMMALREVSQRQERSGHISGRQLADGVCRVAERHFGPLAGEVLAHWGIETSEDLGEIVFAMVEADLLGATEDDSIEDFRGLFEAREAFEDYTIGAGRGVGR